MRDNPFAPFAKVASDVVALALFSATLVAGLYYLSKKPKNDTPSTQPVSTQTIYLAPESSEFENPFKLRYSLIEPDLKDSYSGKPIDTPAEQQIKLDLFGNKSLPEAPDAKPPVGLEGLTILTSNPF